MAHDVFISHSHNDKLAADAACARLEAAGIRCWIAPRDILPGAEWGEAIIEAIEQCRVMVLIFSAKANESRQVRREVERAVGSGATIVPVRIEGVEPTRSLAFFMAGVHWLDALTPPLDHHLQRLAESVGALLRVGQEPREAIDDGSPIPLPDRDGAGGSARVAPGGAAGSAGGRDAIARLVSAYLISVGGWWASLLAVTLWVGAAKYGTGVMVGWVAAVAVLLVAGIVNMRRGRWPRYLAGAACLLLIPLAFSQATMSSSVENWTYIFTAIGLALCACNRLLGLPREVGRATVLWSLILFLWLLPTVQFACAFSAVRSQFFLQHLAMEGVWVLFYVVGVAILSLYVVDGYERFRKNFGKSRSPVSGSPLSRV